LANAVAIAAGWEHSLALKADGTIVGWGRNSEGRLDVPAGLTNPVAVAAGFFHSCYGQAAVPDGFTNIVAIGSINWHNLALMGLEPSVPEPMLLAPRFASGVRDRPFQVRVMAKNNPTGFGAADLPAGLVLDAGRGLITGVPTTTGRPQITLSASNVAGTSQSSLTLFINEPECPPAIITQPADQVARSGSNVVLINVRRTNSGNYSVVVSNWLGTATSSNAALRVMTPQRLAIATPSPPNEPLSLAFGDEDGCPLRDADLAHFQVQASTNLWDWTGASLALSFTNGQVQVLDLARPPQSLRVTSRHLTIALWRREPACTLGRWRRPQAEPSRELSNVEM
jgi:hypothetical protein